MKRGLCILFFSAFSFFVAHADIFEHPLAASSEKEFATVCESISAHSVQKGTFIQTKHVSKLNRDLVSSGTYIISQKDGILWNTQKPFPSVMAVSQSGIMQTNASGKKTKLDAKGNATFQQFSAVISSVFQGNADMLREHFTIYFDGDQKNWTTALVPKEATLRRMISHIQMNGSDSIQSIIMTEENGDSVRYQFEQQTYAETLSDAEKSYFEE